MISYVSVPIHFIINAAKAQALSPHFTRVLFSDLLLLLAIALAALLGLGVVLRVAAFVLHGGSLLSEVLLRSIVLPRGGKNIQRKKIMLDKPLRSW